MILAEVQSTFPAVPEFDWEDDSETCYSWASTRDWELQGLCDGGGLSGSWVRRDFTLDQIKDMAEDQGYDGFSMYYEGSPETHSGQWWANSVFFKICPRQGPEANPDIASALTYKYGIQFYWRMPHPCAQLVDTAEPTETVQMTEEEALELLNQHCIGENSSCAADALNDPALVDLTNELLDIALPLI